VRTPSPHCWPAIGTATCSSRAEILRYLAEVEPRLRATATVEIDATAPLAQVARQLEDLA
jgi:hypothetical protein